MASYGDHQQAEWGQEPGLEESMRRFNLWDRDAYPERPGLTDCAYYMRTGSCGYGPKCRYNHPPDRNSSMGGGEYPERVGEPVCQYYLRTGACKFGALCKFNHPKNAGGSLTNAPLNIYGYPLRPGEKECSYYLKTGQCKFAVTCKFDHPQPQPDGNTTSVSASARPFYLTVQSLSSPSPEHYDTSSNAYRVPRPPMLPGSYYGPMLLPGVVPVPNWNPYPGQISPAPSPSAQPPTSAYGPPQMGSSLPGFTGAYSQLPSSSSSMMKEQKFPERPGQPDCKYYIRTGDCKYGSSCRYNHPPEWVVSKSNCALSQFGLPLRPGVQACSFYIQRGHCKFGRTCKFDHPVANPKYTYTEMPG